MKQIKTLTVNGNTYEIADPDAAHIADQAVGENTWSSQNIVDRLCPAFTESGAAVTCRPVEGYPLEVVSHIPLLETGVSAIRLTRCGKNLVDTKNPKIYHSNAAAPGKKYSLTETGFRAEFLTDRTSNDLGRFGYYLGTAKELAGRTLTISAEFYSSVKGQHTAGNMPYISFYCTNIKPCSNNSNIVAASGGYIGSSGTTTGLSHTSGGSNNLTYTVTGQEPMQYIYAAFQHSRGAGVTGDWGEWSNIQVEIGNVATQYEPYRGQTFTAQLGQTVAGGSYDWASGVLTDGEGNETTLTPTEICGLPGINTVFCDTGDTTVTGKADPAAVMEQLTNAIIALGGNV